MARGALRRFSILSQAFSLAATIARPWGAFRHFWGVVTSRSMPQSSTRTSIPPKEETQSTM